jgi:sulfate transport system permease protein|uniref:Sulfate transport system permease protein n=1 Tax=Galdieria yellowstonensis TaxID=3028027 RepID=A0A9Y1MXH2_9RHOD|nr:sulfate transport system permease protein [Galdieria yellowstonensis]WDA99524.1 sulfate transport system permease protein [Galdieria yellowstonensis]
MSSLFKYFKNLNPLLLIIYFSIILFLPLLNLILNVFKLPLNQILAIATNPVALSAYFLTLKLSLIATLINICFGSCIAYVLTYICFWGKSFIDILIDIPIALPTSLAGFAFYRAYQTDSSLSKIFNKIFKLQLIYSPSAIIMVMVFVSIPFVIRNLQPILLELDSKKEIKESAICLGANSWQIFLFIIFPYIKKSLLTGAVLSFARSIGEFGSIIIISSNLPYKDLVVSVLIAQKLEQYDYQSATVIGTIMLFISLFILSVLNLLDRSSYD